MLKMAKKTYPLFIVVIVFLVSFIFVFQKCLTYTDGTFVYPLDDTYIHLSIAKNFTQSGIWGMTSHFFSSSTSSPLWTLLLSFVMFFLGPNELIPLVMNAVFALLLFVIVYNIMSNCGFKPLVNLAVLFVLFGAPLLHIVFSGLEHVLHAIVSIMIVYLAATLLDSEALNKSKHFFSAKYLLGFLVSIIIMTRYEGMFLLLVIILLFAMKKQFGFSAILLLLGIAPMCLYGFISKLQGWFFFPNTLLVKGTKIGLSSVLNVKVFLDVTYNRLFNNPHISMLVLVAAVLFLATYNKRKWIWDRNTLMLLIFISVVFLHLRFASMGWFYRYEAYLVIIGVVVNSIAFIKLVTGPSDLLSIREKFIKQLAVLLILTLTIFPIFKRSKRIQLIYTASRDIYRQQYQMGRFLAEFYHGQPVALNDIGAATFMSDIELLDLAGLANVEVVRAKLNKSYDIDMIEKLSETRNLRIAIIYDSWFPKGMPPKWIRVGQWKIPDNTICGSDTVSFYAVNIQESIYLEKNLKTFSPKLPEAVIESGRYIDLTE